ncbi:MAG TPA: acyltransferase, partial [Rhodoferax sp.]|nr:acyltransferase [Rhodoferax sp.]
MLNSLPAPLVAFIATLLMVLNIFFWVPILLLFASLKFVLPFKAVRLRIDPILLFIAESWI